MSAVESAIVLLARPTTLIGATTFTTLPLDVSQFGSVQLQLWRGPIRTVAGLTPPDAPTIKFYLEESLDTETWALGPATPVGYDPADDSTGGDPTFAVPQLFAYAFRLRWFRIRVELTGSAPLVTCWAEGFLRDGGGGGSWTRGVVRPPVAQPNIGPSGAVAAGSRSAAAYTGPGVLPPGANASVQITPPNIPQGDQIDIGPIVHK